VDLSRCLTAEQFATPQFGGSPGFGGTMTGFNHGGGPVGVLESVPHGSMHVAVGGLTGWMSAFNTAALDPVFWLQDRLWQVWLGRRASHTNPSEAFWRSGVRFPFRNVDGADVTMVCADVVDTTAPPLEYGYDDVSDPFGEAPMEAALTAEVAMARGRIPEIVGATEAPFELGERAERAVVPTTPVAAALMAESALAEPKRVYLHIEHLTSDNPAPAYDVYLGVPPGDDPTHHPDKRVGRLAMFGVAEASRTGGPHAGSGLTVALDVTDHVARLQNTPGWDPNQLQVSFVPVRDASGARVRVGRVSLYVG
jgi:tyrosinase